LRAAYEAAHAVFHEWAEIAQWRPGETSKQIIVLVIGDLVDELNETFFMNLTNPTNATVADAQGQAERAARLLGSSEKVRETINAPMTFLWTIPA
jgi:hypothetical protein